MDGGDGPHHVQHPHATPAELLDMTRTTTGKTTA